MKRDFSSGLPLWRIVLLVVMGASSASAAEKRIWIDGEAVRYYLKSFLDDPEGASSAGWKAALSDASNQLRGIELVSDRDVLRVKGYLHREVDVTFIPRKLAKRGQIYRARVPESWGFSVHTKDGLARATHLENFQFFAKIPALPDRIVMHQALVDLHLSRATLWLRAMGGVADLVALIDWSMASSISVRWWDSLLLNFGGAFPKSADSNEPSDLADPSEPAQSF